MLEIDRDDGLLELPVIAAAVPDGPPAAVEALRQGRLGSLLRDHGESEFRRSVVTTFQVNVGKLCNQACHHCHVDAGPKRTEIMTDETARRILEVLRDSPSVEIMDITGGAPELTPCFPSLVRGASALDKSTIVRCNLTVLFEPGMGHLPELYVENGVEIIASLPCYLEENVDKQRGVGVFDKSIEALQLLNRLGYGREGSGLSLHLVFNPLGAYLPSDQEALEQDYKKELGARYGIEFNQLFTITNMPISRFAEQLAREGKAESYMELLVQNFNPTTLPHLMCRSVISVSWDGKLYDCDFNQMLELPTEDPARPASYAAPTIWDVSGLEEFTNRRIRTADHCLGCTAGTGSSCTGSLT